MFGGSLYRGKALFLTTSVTVRLQLVPKLTIMEVQMVMGMVCLFSVLWLEVGDRDNVASL